MAGTVTTTEESLGKIDKVTFTWASATTGAADATTTQAYAGRVKQVLIYAGATTPTDQYDVQVLNASSIDLLFGEGANCSNTDTVVVDECGYVVSERLTLAVTNAGSEKTGSVVVYIEE